MQVDYVERRESEPRLTREQAEEELAAEREAQREDVIRHHRNAACNAIKETPLELVDAAYIGQVLDTLSCRAMEAFMPEIAEEIGDLACKVTP